MIGLDSGHRGAGFQFRIIEKQDHIVIQRALIAFQRQRVVALLIDDLLGNAALAAECIRGHDGALQGQHAEQFGAQP